MKNDKYIEKFIKGLQKYDIPYSDIKEGKWRYVGGDTQTRHINYYKLRFGHSDFPEKQNKCICGHPIKENCYLSNDLLEEVIVIGNYCIKKFLPKDVQTRTCELCNKVHRNRIVNRCNECRI